MGYTIELSFDLRKRTKVTQLLLLAKDIAELCDSVFHYNCSDSDERNQYIVSSEFDELEQLISYIEKINETKGFHIDCIYHESDKCSLVFASLKYVKQMDSFSAQQYRLKKKQCNYTPNEKLILDQIHKYKSK